MALTDGMIGLILAEIALYYFLYNNKVRLWRICGAIGVALLPIFLVMIEDSAVMYAIWMVNLLIGLIKLIQEVGQIIPHR